MKKFIVKSDGRQFKVKATDYESAIKAVSLVKDSVKDYNSKNEILINGREYDKIQRNDIVRKYGLNVEFNLTNPFVRSAKAAVYVVSGPDANKLKKILGDSVKDEANLPTTIQALVNDEEAAVKAVKEVTAKDRSWLDIKRGDIIMSDRLDKTAKYRVTNVVTNREGRPEFATVERLESAALKRKDDPYAFRPVRIRVDNGTRIVDAMHTRDEASPLQTVNALLEDERAAVDAYNVALENLKGKIPDESYAAIEAIRNDENRHIENLQAVVNGTVTEKNLEDSVKDNFYAIRTRNNGRVGEWYVKADSEQKAFDIVKRQPGHQFDAFVSIKQVNENELKRVGARIIS